MGNWWDKGYSSKSSKSYGSGSYSNSDVETGAEDLAKEVNENSSEILDPMFVAFGMMIKRLAEKMGESMGNTVDWRWPHE